MTTDAEYVIGRAQEAEGLIGVVRPLEAFGQELRDNDVHLVAVAHEGAIIETERVSVKSGYGKVLSKPFRALFQCHTMAGVVQKLRQGLVVCVANADGEAVCALTREDVRVRFSFSLGDLRLAAPLLPDLWEAKHDLPILSLVYLAQALGIEVIDWG